MKVFSSKIVTVDRAGREFETYVSNESTRDEMLRQAKEPGADGAPRVAKIEEDTSEPSVSKFVPLGFGVLMIVHLGTILISFALMPLYIILAVKNEQLDQTARIIWVVLFCTVGMFTMPVYWFLNIWRSSPSGGNANPT